MPETAAPIRKPPSAVSSIAVISAIFLISTITPRFQYAGAHLDQKISTAGQDTSRTSGRSERLDRFIKRIGRQISEFRHGGSVISLFCPPHMAAALSPARSCGRLHGQTGLEQPPGCRFWRQAPMQEAGLPQAFAGIGGAYRRNTLALISLTGCRNYGFPPDPSR